MKKKAQKLRNTAAKSVQKVIKESETIITSFQEDNIFNERIIALRDTFLEKINKIKDYDEIILDLIQEDAKLEEFDNEATDFSIYCKEKLNLINTFIHKQRSLNDETVTVNSQNSKSVRLPKITIKHFDGQPEKWNEFIDSYNCAIHDNDSISDVQKMTYLKNLVEGTAAETIAGLKISKENYLISLNLLKERYSNKHLQVTTHMNKLLELKPINDLKHVTELRDIYNTVETQIRSLESLGIDSSMYGPFLIPVFQRKIPSELNLIISRKFTSDECWDIKEVLEAFKLELMAREKSNFSATSTETSQISAASLVVNSKSRDSKQRKFSCVFCDKNHKPQHCRIVTNLDARKLILKDKNRCFKCLRTGHSSKKCRSQIKCYNCDEHHHLAMCDAPKSKNDKSKPSDQSDEEAHEMHVNSSPSQSILLQTAKVMINNNSAHHGAYILFDNGSQLSFITPALRNKLNLKTHDTREIVIKTFGEHSTKEILERVKVSIKCLDGHNLDIFCYVKDICQPLNNQHIKFARENYEHLRGLHLANFTDNPTHPVDILVGSDFYWSIIENEIIRGPDNCPIALKSKFGYILSGPINFPSSKNSSTLVTHALKCQTEFIDQNVLLNKELETFWQQETYVDTKSDNDVNFDVHVEFQRNLKFNKIENRYEVKLPFRDDHDLLPDNYSHCVERFNSLKRKLSHDSQLFAEYNQIFIDQLASGIIEAVPEDSSNIITAGQSHYLPHRPVVRTDKTTTKVRCVFDASSKTVGPSLNDCLYPGPSLTETLFGVLLRFRTYKVAFISDIQKAFLQILLNTEHRDYVRFLWFRDLNNIDFHDLNDAEMAVYRMCRVLFGVTSSPFLLSATIIEHVKKLTNYLFSHKLLKSLHVDDLCSGGDNILEVDEFYDLSRQTFSEANFTLHKFESNSPELEHKYSTVETSQIAKILGLTWNKTDDTFIFSLHNILPLAVAQPTKRQLIQFFASIYDPLGLLNPFVVKLKILFQKVCIANINWDSVLYDDLLVEWTLIRNDLLTCSEFVVSRWCHISKDIVRLELHGFSDASLRAYGACVYIRVFDAEGCIEVSLLAARSRIAPVKGMTIPRLELMSCVLLSNLVDRVCKEFEGFVKVDEIFCWNDSMVALHWISSEKKINDGFVRRRVEKVRSLVPVDKWYHVESRFNPADILSRGAFLSPLHKNELWLQGPSFLGNFTDFEQYRLKNKLDEIVTLFTSEDDNLNKNERSETSLFEVVDVSRYNDYTKLLHVISYILRFISNVKAKVSKDELNLRTYLKSEETAYAEHLLLLDCQKNLKLMKNYKQLEKDLRLFTDENGLVRCKGRLENAPLPYSAKFPIFLPRSDVSILIIKHYHEVVLHNGVKDTLNELRTKFWMPKARNYIRSLIFKCRRCKNVEGKPYSYPESPALPTCRLSATPPFYYTGVDYAGPIYVKDIFSTSNITHKAWIFLFTCSNSRAICLDLVPDSSSPSCIRGLKRFFSRRGAPKSILSDNGTNFTAADTQQFASNYGTDWQFNPPASPWWGGIYERLVRSTKRCLKKILWNAKLSYEEVLTILLEIELVLNNRPLTFTYEEPGDEVLTPNHLLFGRRLSKHAPDEKFNDEISITHRYDYIQNILNQFWQRWRNEYVLELREHHKSLKHSKVSDCNIGDVVLIHEDKIPRALFKVGIIESFKPSRDKIKRVALVRYINSEDQIMRIYRPVNKLYQLETATNDKAENIPDIPEIKFVDDKDVFTKVYY